ncbi:MAG: hypothetical protein IT340_01275 [Chloroflexi bacterium]|nr:hypothetical protein [Chloroflexota bacterium]
MSKRRKQPPAGSSQRPPASAPVPATPATTPPTQRGPVRRAPTRRWPSALTLSLIVGLAVVAVVAFSLTRPPAAGQEQPRDNVTGSASAPVVVEKWEDFQ